MSSVESMPLGRAAAREAPVARTDSEIVQRAGSEWIDDPAATFDGPNCVYLSPHHDDVCFSLGGLIRHLPGGRMISLFTRSGYIRSLPAATQPDADAIAKQRADEDDAFAVACRLSKVDLGLSDAPMLGRRPMDLRFLARDCATLRPALLARLRAIADATPAHETLTLFCPAGIGGHSNHVATTRTVVDLLPLIEDRYRVLFYEDLPYAANPRSREPGLLRLFAVLSGRRGIRLAVDFSAASKAKLALIHLYRSQFATPPPACDRYSPAALDGAYRLHEAVWDFGIGTRTPVRPVRTGGRSPPSRQTLPMKPPSGPNQRERLVAALLTHGDGAAPKPMYLPMQLGAPKAPDGNFPMVTAIMVTADRPQQARLSIECYRRQSWPNRRLLIANAGEDRSLEQWLTALGDPSIEHHRTPRDGHTLGDLRNLIGEKAEGDFVCVWDDDDLSHPHRIEAQMAAVSATGADACALARLTIWAPAMGQIAIPKHRAWEGTLLCRRSAMPRYASLETIEDTPVVRVLTDSHRFILLDAADLYIYVCHSTNVSGEDHFRGLISRAPDQASGANYGLLLTQLAGDYPIREYLSFLTKRSA